MSGIFWHIDWFVSVRLQVIVLVEVKSCSKDVGKKKKHIDVSGTYYELAEEKVHVYNHKTKIGKMK